MAKKHTDNPRRWAQGAFQAESEALEEEMRLAAILRPRTLAACPLTTRAIVIDGETVSLQRDDGRIACPWVSCPWHSYLDVGVHGSVTVFFPGQDPGEIPEPCGLDLWLRNDEARNAEGEEREPTFIELGIATNQTRSNLERLAFETMAKLRDTPLARRLARDYLRLEAG